MTDKISLATARRQDKLDQFIAEHDGETGDQVALERVILSMAGTSKEAPEASSPPERGD